MPHMFEGSALRACSVLLFVIFLPVSAQAAFVLRVASMSEIAPSGSVTVSSGAALGQQLGNLVIEFFDDANFASQSVDVTITLDNMIFNTTVGMAAVESFNAVGTPPACLATATGISGGEFRGKTVAFTIDNLIGCTGMNTPEQVVRITLPVALDTLSGTGNFSIKIDGASAPVVPEMAYDADGNGRPLITVADPIAVAIDKTLDGAADVDPTLQLAGELSFARFAGDALSADLGRLSVEAVANVHTDIRETALVTIVDQTASLTFENASGVAGVTVGASPLTKSGNSFSGNIAAGADQVVTVTLSGDAAVAGQAVTASVAGTADDVAASSAVASGPIATLLREGSASARFRWVGLGTENSARNIFRLTGLNPAGADVVLVTLNGLSDGSPPVENMDITGMLKVGPGGEVLVDGRQLGQFAGLQGTVRGSVSFFVEALDVKVQRLLLTAGGVTSTGSLNE